MAAVAANVARTPLSDGTLGGRDVCDGVDDIPRLPPSSASPPLSTMSMGNDALTSTPLTRTVTVAVAVAAEEALRKLSPLATGCERRGERASIGASCGGEEEVEGEYGRRRRSSDRLSYATATAAVR